MTYKRSIYLILILLGLFLHRGFGQTAHLQGTINNYASIVSILAYNENDVDSVVVISLPGGFEEGDTVMIHCVQGAEIELTDIFGEDDIGRDAQHPRNTGKYAFLIITEIAGNTVVFNTTVRPEIGPLGPGEVAQLIEVPSYHRAEVMASGVSAPAWNGSTGGVVAMFVRSTLKLNGNINVSGLGFRGAVATKLYGGACSSTDPDLYDSTFYHIDNIRAGKKGEGTTDTLFDLMRGKAMNINGGGGGNARFAGGGGGSNYSSGGKGGFESSQCAPGVDAPGGAGGFDLGRSDAYYLNKSEDIIILNRYDRIFFGGGGGTGTRMTGRTTTSGGNGGGMVVIVADTIDGNGGKSIIADGGDVTTNATGAGGGGGGGGAIILDVSGYRNNLQLSAVGGDGGDTNHPTDTTGPGGGGGGGVYWLAGTAEPGVTPVTLSNGKSGEHLSTPRIRYGAADGSFPARKNGLDAPLRGFLFNSVPGEFWVCSDQVPETIYASQPKGGNGTYNYVWVDSSSTQNQWLPVAGATGQHLVFSAPLSDTTYYRRIVTSSLLPADTSFRIAVNVHPAISNNIIAAPDTVCFGLAPKSFTSVGTPGQGVGLYNYKWVQHEGDGAYSAAPGVTNLPGYSAPGLESTTYFARIVISGACADTSGSLTVTVLPSLTGNDISDKDTICWNTRPDLITGPVPVGGDGAPKRYRWESSALSGGPWTPVGVTTKDYRPGPLTATTWYRRVAFSGSDDACKDTSNALEILNIAVIENNTILSAAQEACWTDQPEMIQASQPGGGDQVTYYYQWESSTATTGWVAADNTHGSNQMSYTPPVMNGDTTWFRRIVGSGGAEGVCKDTTGSVVINVLPEITNNKLLPTEDVKCQFDMLGNLLQDVSGGNTPGGGATQGGTDATRNYKWEQATGPDAPGSWSEVSYGPSAIDYTENPELPDEDDYWYRRIVFSGPLVGAQERVCADTSEVVRVTIHTAITGNTIDAADSACYQSEKVLQGQLPTGEPDLDPTYTWIDLLAGTTHPGGQDFTRTIVSQEPHQFRRVANIGVCADTSNMMVVTVMQLPGGMISGGLPRACEEEVTMDITLNMDTLTNFVIPWEVYLSDGVNMAHTGPYFMDGTGQVAVLMNTDEDSTLFDYTIGEIIFRSTTGRYECGAPPENLEGNVPIKVFRTPVPKITVDAMERDSFKVCGNEVALMVNPDRGSGMWTSNYPDFLGFLPNPEAVSVRANIDPNDSVAFANQKYTVTYTSWAGVCDGTDSIEIHYFEQPAKANPGKDTMIFLKNSLYLNADPPSAGIGTWTTTGSGKFEDEHSHNTFVYDLDKGEQNAFRWTIVNGEDEGTCIETDSVVVVTQNEVRRYEGFSPNGDNINDVFIIQGLVDADEFSISFFNALGKTVREITDRTVEEIVYNPDMIPGGLKEDEMVIWDGFATNGNPVPPGTYYYVVSMMIHQVDHLDRTIGTDRYEYKDYVIVRE